jgi:hypothetical protein
MGAATCFHCHRAWLQLCGKRDHPVASHPSPHDNRTVRVEADDAAAVLAQVDAKDHNTHGSLLPSLNTATLHRRRREGRAIHKGGRARQIGRTKGGINTKLHAVTEAKGRPIRFFMSAGQVSDYTGAAE